MVASFVEPVPLSARIRFSLREALRAVYHAPGRLLFRQRLARLRAARDKTPRVNFGWTHQSSRPPDTGIGGAVKLGHLRNRFGEALDEFNILYLVSSTLHMVPYPEDLAGWAKRNGVRVVWNQNGVAYPAWCGNFYPWFNAPMRRLIQSADFVIYQSRFCKQSADRYLGRTRAPSEILYNPVDLDRFRPAAERPDTSTWRLLAMGTSHAFYRVKASLDCLSALRSDGMPAVLAIAGELRWPNANAEVAAYIKQLGIGQFVTLLPRFSQEEAPGIYRSAHVLLHPKYKDPCPTVPIEAMACGLPVVGSRSGGLPELLSEYAGVLIETPEDWTSDHAPDPHEMAAATTAIFSRYIEFSSKARGRAEAVFDSHQWVERHESIFEVLIEA